MSTPAPSTSPAPTGPITGPAAAWGAAEWLTLGGIIVALAAIYAAIKIYQRQRRDITTGLRASEQINAYRAILRALAEAEEVLVRFKYDVLTREEIDALPLDSLVSKLGEAEKDMRLPEDERKGIGALAASVGTFLNGLKSRCPPTEEEISRALRTTEDAEQARRLHRAMLDFVRAAQSQQHAVTTIQGQIVAVRRVAQKQLASKEAGR